MDGYKIEMESIGKLTNIINRNDNLRAIIDSNDKTPSWDGFVEVYYTEEHQKSNMAGRIPIQVKGKLNPDFSKDTINYPVEIADLKNYSHDGGVVFFVICVANFDDFKIYYNSLLPYDIKILMAQYEKRKNKEAKTPTITIMLHHFNYSYDISDIPFWSFLKDKEKQFSTVAYAPTNKEEFDRMKGIFNGYQFEFIARNGIELIDIMFAQPFYTYGITKDSGVKIPISKTDCSMLEFGNIKANVTLGNEVFFTDYTHRFTANNHTLIFASGGIQFDFVERENFHYNIKGSLKNRIKIIEFLLELPNHSEVKIGGEEVFTYSFPDNIIPDSIQDELSFYKEIQSLLAQMGVVDDLELDNLTKSDNENLHAIYRGIYKNERLPIDEKTSSDSSNRASLNKLKISNLYIGVIYLTHLQEKNLEILNMFSENILQYSAVWQEDSNTDKIQISIYMMLKKEDFEQLSNANYNLISKDIINKGYSQQYADFVNPVLLDMISAYDINRDMTLLEACITVSKWLMDNNPIPTTMINYMQCIKRCRSFSDSEIKQIYALKASNDALIQFAIAVLLENNNDIKYYFSGLPHDVKASYKNYPISFFCHDLLSDS